MDLIKSLSKKAFWDVDMNTMDAEKHAAFIIEKVFEHGKWNDILAITRFYGRERVKQVTLNYTSFFPDTASFLAAIFDKPIEEIKCFRPRQSPQNVTN